MTAVVPGAGSCKVQVPLLEVADVKVKIAMILFDLLLL
jgi:hypothetical protein